jgi:hypothetical protein
MKLKKINRVVLAIVNFYENATSYFRSDCCSSLSYIVLNTNCCVTKFLAVFLFFGYVNDFPLQLYGVYSCMGVNFCSISFSLFFLFLSSYLSCYWKFSLFLFFWFMLCAVVFSWCWWVRNIVLNTNCCVTKFLAVFRLCKWFSITALWCLQLHGR